MSILVEDTPRNNFAAWTTEALASGLVSGGTASPFSSPFVSTTYKPSCSRMVAQIRDAGGEVWFDAATHALGMPGVGDFRYYDQWELWAGNRGDMGNPALLRDHVLRVLAIQSELGTSFLAPTVLLPTASGPELVTAIAMSVEALAAQPATYLTIAGSTSFWSAGDDLDAYVAAVAQLGAVGVFLVVVRATGDLPTRPAPQEIAGLCRTTRSLVQFGKVHISHGDFAALPAIAAGATSLGTGWDSRQRVCNYASYVARAPTADGGGWFQRPTFRGLFASLSRAQAETFFNQASRLATELHVGPLHPNGPKEAFLHHARSLGEAVSQISAAGSHEQMYRELAAMYALASSQWSAAAVALGTNSMAPVTVEPLHNGLNVYAAEEGWT